MGEWAMDAPALAASPPVILSLGGTCSALGHCTPAAVLCGDVRVPVSAGAQSVPLRPGLDGHMLRAALHVVWSWAKCSEAQLLTWAAAGHVVWKTQG